MFGRIVGIVSVLALVTAVGGVTRIGGALVSANGTPQLQAAGPHEDDPAPEPEDPGSDSGDDSGDDYAR